MHPDEFERRMRALECYHALRMPPGAWIILRLDGRGFSRLTESADLHQFYSEARAKLASRAKI
jgi:tRNA(His) 5'-end guanylyltransferase